MEMEKICIELPIVRIEQSSPIFNNDFAKEHYPTGLFIVDDGVVRHLMSYDGVYVNAIPCPHDVIEKHLVERAIIDNDAIYHRDMEAIEERLAVIEKLCADSNSELYMQKEARVNGFKAMSERFDVLDASFDVLEKCGDLILDTIAEKDKENKEDHTSMINFWHELKLKRELGGGEGVNILDVAKSFAVIQKPELIKELNK